MGTCPATRWSFFGSRVLTDGPRANTLTVMLADVLLLGVDGGGTKCRARLTDWAGTTLGEGEAGPANIRFGLEDAFSAILRAADQWLQQAGVSYSSRRIVACLALAGMGDLAQPREAQSYPHPFFALRCTSDAHAACVGAHAGQDGGIIIAGTGSIGWAIIGERTYRVGGWGFPVSDEGSGAWLGCEAVRRVLWAHDGLIGWTDVLRGIFEQLGSDAHAIVRWMSTARPRDFGSVAPIIVAHAAHGDPVAKQLLRGAARHIDRLGERLLDIGVCRLSLMGGLAGAIGPLLGEHVGSALVRPAGDALSGALRLARLDAEQLALT